VTASSADFLGGVGRVGGLGWVGGVGRVGGLEATAGVWEVGGGWLTTAEEPPWSTVWPHSR
jgi:hypothetical protein